MFIISNRGLSLEPNFYPMSYVILKISFPQLGQILEHALLHCSLLLGLSFKALEGSSWGRIVPSTGTQLLGPRWNGEVSPKS